VPTPISEEEMSYLKTRMGIEDPKYKIDFAVGDLVKILDGPFKDYEGKVADIDEAKGKVKVFVSIFGRETPLELDFLQVKKA
jgi:transcriptional antiterminator NusG